MGRRKKRESDMRNGLAKGTPGAKSKVLAQSDEVRVWINCHVKSREKGEAVKVVAEKLNKDLKAAGIDPRFFRSRLVSYSVKQPPMKQCACCHAFHVDEGVIIDAVYIGREDIAAKRREVPRI